MGNSSRIMAALAILAICLSVFSCAAENIPNRTIEITVNDETDGTSVPSLPSSVPGASDENITHYGFSLSYGSTAGGETAHQEEIFSRSQGTRYTIANIPEGDYTVTVRGYIQMEDSSYHLIAEDSYPITVGPSMQESYTLDLRTLSSVPSGDIRITAVLPESMTHGEGWTASVSYGLSRGVGSSESDILPETRGTALLSASSSSFVLNGSDGSPLSLQGGVYALWLTVSSGSESREAMGLLRVLPGLPVEAAVHFESEDLFDIPFSVSDGFGNDIVITGSAGSISSDDSVVVTVSSVPEGAVLAWYLNGVEIVPAVSGSSYTITGLKPGYAVIQAVAYDDTATGIGSLSFSLEVSSVDIKPIEHLLFTDNGDGTCTVTGENPDQPFEDRTDLLIPSYIYGLAVTEIGDNAFEESDFTGTLILPETLVRIGKNSFCRSSFTGELIIPDSVTHIGHMSFYDVPLTGSLVIPDNVEMIDNYAFSSCGFTGTLLLGRGLKTLDNGAFQDTLFTGSLVLPDGLETINGLVFDGTSFTGDLFIPLSVQTIGDYAFRDNSFASVSCEAASEPSGWESSWWRSAGVEEDDIIWGASRPL